MIQTKIVRKNQQGDLNMHGTSKIGFSKIENTAKKKVMPMQRGGKRPYMLGYLQAERIKLESNTNSIISV